MKLTNAMKAFIYDYVNQNMPKVYDEVHYVELDDALKEEVRTLENSFRAELKECVHNFIERYPEFEGVTAELSNVYVVTRHTPAYMAKLNAHNQRDADSQLIIKRMYASVGTLKSMEELIETMDALIAEFKE